jgi:hypothetical protein
LGQRNDAALVIILVSAYVTKDAPEVAAKAGALLALPKHFALVACRTLGAATALLR